MNVSNKTVVIIEGADGTGKTQLCKFLQDFVEGKCHILHSNYNKNLPEDNHWRQHKLITKFINNQFDDKHYTGNRMVILDRNYISDIVYGQIGYGSKGTVKQKCKKLKKLFRLLRKNANVLVVYCNPAVSNFDACSVAREELLTKDENIVIRNLYDKFFNSYDFGITLVKSRAKYYIHDFKSDPKFEQIKEFLLRNSL